MRKKTVTRTLLFAGALLIAAGSQGTAPALADSALVVQSVRMDISGLDLARPQDARVLQHRIEKAARAACGPEPYLVTPDPPGYLGYETCYRRAERNAQLTIAALTASAHPGNFPNSFRRWVHVHTAVLMPGANAQMTSEEGMRHIFANEKAVEGYASGHFADGSIIVYELRQIDQHQNGVIFEGERKRVDVMIKDSSHYPGTGGWRFERFQGNDAAHDVLPDSGAACFGCHSKATARDSVFSELP